MALLLTSLPSLQSRFPNKLQPISPLSSSKSSLLFFNSLNPTRRIPPILRLQSSLQPNSEPSSDPSPGVTDEWGEKSEAPETTTYTFIADSDPPEEKDEWGGDVDVAVGNGTPVAVVEDKNGDLKRCLVDSVYGTDLGFGAGAEVRAEVMELVNQLEAANPTPAPYEATELLDGNWVLVYTASSELLPLLAATSIPLLKIDQIAQSIDSSNLTILNSITLSSPLGSISFSASASFEIRSPSRIQVQFKEGTFPPPVIKPAIDLPDSVELFGQNISLSPLQQSLGPLQEVVGSLSRAISGQPPLKVPIPGETSESSWLLTTYLDKDLRISRGDGGLFVLVKEGSPLLS